MIFQKTGHDLLQNPQVRRCPSIPDAAPACMHMFAGAHTVKIIMLGKVMEKTSTFSLISPIFAMMEKCLFDLSSVHEFLPGRQEPKITSGWTLTREITCHCPSRTCKFQEQIQKSFASRTLIALVPSKPFSILCG